jgi:hypothetical protein
VRNGVIYASLCGTVAQQQQKDASEEPSTSGVGMRQDTIRLCREGMHHNMPCHLTWFVGYHMFHFINTETYP